MNLGLLLGGAAALYFLTKKKPQSVKQTQPSPEGQPGYWFYDYDCKTIEIFNEVAWGKFHKDAVKQAFEQLKLPVEKILDFKNYVLKFCENYMKLIQEGAAISCPFPKDEMEVTIRYVLSAGAIEDLGALILGDQIDMGSEEYQKWTLNSIEYFKALKASLGIKTEAQEKMLIDAEKVFEATGKLG